MQFIVQGMTCGHCVRSVISAVHAIDPAAVVDVDLAAKTVSVQSSTADAGAIEAAIADAGYEIESEKA